MTPNEALMRFDGGRARLCEFSATHSTFKVTLTKPSTTRAGAHDEINVVCVGTTWIAGHVHWKPCELRLSRTSLENAWPGLWHLQDVAAGFSLFCLVVYAVDDAGRTTATTEEPDAGEPPRAVRKLDPPDVAPDRAP